jgi:hypothetical protein
MKIVHRGIFSAFIYKQGNFMANKNNIKPRREELKEIEKLQSSLFAANNGISKSFVDKYDKRIQISNVAVSNVLQGFGYGIIGNNTNSISELANIVQQSITHLNRSAQISFNRPSIDEDPSGIKMLTPIGNVDMAEQDIISANAALYQSFLNITSEYRGVVELIPEVKRAIENIVRDIVNVSEITNRAFSKIYEDKFNRSINQSDKDADARKNQTLIKEIVDKNNLEYKFKRWVFESAVCGVKPVAFIPYSYIFRQLQNSHNKDFGLNVNDFNIKIQNGESFRLFNDEDKQKSFYKKNIETSLLDCVRSFESVASGKSAPGITYENLLDEIIDENSAESFAEIIENDINMSIESLSKELENAHDMKYKRMFMGLESNADLDNEINLIDNITRSYKDKKEKIKQLPKEDRIRESRNGLKKLVEFIDDKIRVPKKESAAAVYAEKLFREKDRYDVLYKLGTDFKMAENVKRSGYTTKDKFKNNLSGTYDIKSSLGKECLIVPYAPESVIPININGEYMGFYCLEYEHIVGAAWNKRKKAGGISDFIKSQGIGDDASLIGGNNMSAWGGVNPIESNLYSPLTMYNLNASRYLNGNMNNLEDERRFDMMKMIVLRVLSHRLHDPDLVDNKIFKDAVMHLLRNNILANNRVQFTFIPPEYMCYMTWKTDDDGLPESILKGTLYDCYMHISCKTSSGMLKLMKSSDKEKYEIEVGLSKNTGLSVSELQRVLSTRSLYTQSAFSDLSSVIRNAGSYQRLIIPVIKGQKVYDVSQMEHMNDLNPDDEFTDKELQRVLDKIGYNNGMFSELDNVDFAKQLYTRNIEYGSRIIDGQSNYNPFGTKMLRILVDHSLLPTYNSIADDIKQITKSGNDTDQLHNDIKEEMDNDEKIDLACIELMLAMPSYLQMISITDTIDTAKTMANSIAEVYGASGGNAIDDATNDLFKLSLMKKFTNNIDWDVIDKMREQAISDSKKIAADKVKTNTIDQSIQNPQDAASSDIAEAENQYENGGSEDAGSGSATDDMGGGDMSF